MSAEYTHSPTPEEIMEYLDGEGTAASRDAIAAHLATCGTCEAAAADMSSVSAHAQAWTVNAAPASLQAPPSARANLLRFRCQRTFVLRCEKGSQRHAAEAGAETKEDITPSGESAVAEKSEWLLRSHDLIPLADRCRDKSPAGESRSRWS